MLFIRIIVTVIINISMKYGEIYKARISSVNYNLASAIQNIPLKCLTR